MIMLWLKSKAVPLTAAFIAILLVALLSVSGLYALKSKDYEAKAKEVDTVTEKLVVLESRIEDEQRRNRALNIQINTAKANLQKRINELDALKKNKAYKETVKQDPKSYEIKSQESLDDYMKRMGCLSGNTTLCTKP